MAASILRRLPPQQELFDRSPRWLQRLLVNAEAMRRERFRRHGDYARLVAEHDPAWYALPRAAQDSFQAAQLDAQLRAVRAQVPHYRATLPDSPIHSLDDLRRLPITEKDALRTNLPAFVSERVPRRDLWARKTSGSTGAPLTFYTDRATTCIQQAAADAMLAAYGCRFGERRARFSGAYVAPYERAAPPFWIWIDHYRQLQCSAYHLAPRFFPAYLQALRDARVAYGTGYPTAWHLLAGFILETGAPPPPLRAIITDSEGITFEQQDAVERAFGCPVYQTYGAGEIGQIAWQCRHRRYHVLGRAVVIEILDEHDQPVRPGETGHVVATTLVGPGTPFVRYRTGDLATLAPDDCPCGLHSLALLAIEGRLDDRLRTPDGRWVRVGGHLVKGAVGVRESQVVQTAPDRVVVRVVPGAGFDPGAMDAAVRAAHRYLGSQVHVTWESVERLPRTTSGKLRHVVREC